MKGHYTITEKMCKDAIKSHPYTSRQLGNRNTSHSIQAIQNGTIQVVVRG